MTHICINGRGKEGKFALIVVLAQKKSPHPPVGGLKGLIKVGDDLLSHFRSTIGAVGLNFSVRNGKRWNPDAIVT